MCETVSYAYHNSPLMSIESYGPQVVCGRIVFGLRSMLVVRCCRWMFPRAYKDMDDSDGGVFASTGPPPRPRMVAATLGRPMESREEVSELERQRRRELAVERAQQRQDSATSRGVRDVSKVKKMQEQNDREVLMGRIAEQYAKLGEEVPMGLRLADISLLRRHLEQVQGTSRDPRV